MTLHSALNMLNDSLPLTLYHKSKDLLWDPRAIDLTQDALDWRGRMTPTERDLIARLSVLFLGGERAVTHDLAPMLTGVRRLGGRIEEEMFLTAQLFEESKHVEFFERVAAIIADAANGIDPGDAYRELFNHRLPNALNRLCDPAASPRDHVAALCVYHMTIEGVLAETGYRGYVRALKSNGLMPGVVRGVELVQRDEARHIAYGLHALENWIRREPALRAFADEQLGELLALVMQIITDAFTPYGDDMPFGLDLVEFATYAGEQFDRRMSALDRAHPSETT
jgi:ribonucleoside-diphosphate reductase beta chain